MPTGYRGDTKAEENGWEADVLAAALGLFPDDEAAPRWFQRMREFAVNSYSHPSDASDQTVIDASYDQQRICDLYRGQNLYDDYTLQNHNYFHTSYQNVVMQELGEAALALKLFGGDKWWSNSLMHNNQQVMDEVLKWLALDDGELAMPNGNDWSLFLYDQITSYTTMACLLHDPDALMLERRAAEMICHRQHTTPDGSWLLRSDIGARRMGVEAHRVMMTWLMHHVWPTGRMEPTRWDDFLKRYGKPHLLPCQQVVTAATATGFSCFSWSSGLKSYTGYIAPFQTDGFAPCRSNLVVPFKAHNTGNIVGWYEVEGRPVNAVPAEEPCLQTDGRTWTVHGHLHCNDAALDQRFTIHYTADGTLVYTDTVLALADCTILCEKGGLMAVSEDEMTVGNRKYVFGNGWVNVDNRLGIVNSAGKQMKVDRPFNNNSVTTALLYASYDDRPRHYRKGEMVDCRRIVFHVNVTSQETRRLAGMPQ